MPVVAECPSCRIRAYSRSVENAQFVTEFASNGAVHFRTQVKTTKSLVNTFVTTFGVADGVHRSIVHSEVTMDDLFA